MKRIIVWIALLLGSAMDPLLAQRAEINYAFDTRLDREAFQKDYPDFLDAVTLEVKLSKGNVLLLKSQNYRASRLVQRPDSLVGLFWQQYASFLEQVPISGEVLSVVYRLEEGQPAQIRWKKYPVRAEEFSVVEGEVVQLKTGQDTLRIEVLKTNQQRAELYLLLNDLREVPRLLDELREKTIFLVQALEQELKPKVLERSPEVYGRYLGDRQVRVGNYARDMLIFSPGVSLGYVRGHWHTAYHNEMTLYLDRFRLKTRLGFQHQFFFDRSLEGTLQMFENHFLVAGFSFFEKTRDSPGLGHSGVKQEAQVTVGYLIGRQGTYYEPHTWRVAGGFNLTPFLKVEPELYFHGAFKQLSPGLRLTVGF
ncbi:hypothetical protein GCM10027275_03490 [Rhabdobacter roseus]|uniref:DUF3575 domain-containing protein n=1 Tax=Rhabdobacter roseus TaxID=1655419 RepID=A0A840TR63_9BACT|nr:hypothetical protein [Rhabdobacter roseus]MBB5282239.1 hypothetical protein [Rhabdobacter roseus]